jgi:hypothetical protein
VNVYELEKRATPGPLIVTNDCCGYSALAMTEQGESVFGGCGKRGDADVRLAAHCRNNFLKALEALKQQLDIGAFAGDRLPIKVWQAHAAKLRTLIAELEEVKT